MPENKPKKEIDETALRLEALEAEIMDMREVVNKYASMFNKTAGDLEHRVGRLEKRAK